MPPTKKQLKRNHTTDRRLHLGRLKTKTRRQIDQLMRFGQLSGPMPDPDPRWAIASFDAFEEARNVCEAAGIPVPKQPKIMDVTFSANEIADMNEDEVLHLYHTVNGILGYALWIEGVAQLQEEVWESKFVVALEDRKTRVPGKNADEREAEAMGLPSVKYRFRQYWRARTVRLSISAMVKRYSVYSDSLARQINFHERRRKPEGRMSR